jgi:1-aminocyclopropane-1-carboxylate synthase 1/2/6
MVSATARRLTAGVPAIAAAHFRAEAMPYHPSECRDGWVNLGTAENRLVWDLLEPRLGRLPAMSEVDTRYAPLHGTPALRAAVARHLGRLTGTGVEADELVVVSGATGALDVLAAALCDPGEAIVVPAPYYGAFRTDLGGRSGAVLVPAPTGSADGFALSPAAVEQAVLAARAGGSTVRAIALTSPANPTGLVHPAGVLAELVELARRLDLDLIADEIYAGSVFGRTPFHSLAGHDGVHSGRIHLVWGFAKDFGLPGLKVGVLHSRDPELLAAARALAYFAPVSTHTQALLADLLADERWCAGFAATARARLAESYRACTGALDRHHIPYLPAEAGFAVWLDLRRWLPEPSGAGERALWTDLFERGRVSILPGAEFGCPEPGWFRLCHSTAAAVVAAGVARIAGVLAPAKPAPGPFDTWYDTAGVRSGVRRDVGTELERGFQFYPRGLVPHLAHEAVRALPPARQDELVQRYLYQFLLSTAHLETRVVNAGAELIANGRSGVDLPMRLRLDAFRVYCDEGYHALYSLDLADQLAAVTGVSVPPWDYGGFVTALRRAGSAALPGEPELAGLLQTVVFETMVTAVLNEVPNDPTVLSVVRDVTRDHARDEGRHHRFFATFFHQLWSTLDRRRRETAARALPELIRGCLVWDVEPVRGALVLAGLDGDTAADVIAGCYGGDAGTARIADIARATVRMCESAGVLDEPGARDAFRAGGLLGPGR